MKPHYTDKMKKNHLLPKKDIKIFTVDNKEYFYYVPKGHIYGITNPYFKEYLNLCQHQDASSQNKISKELIKEIYDYIIETTNKYISTYVTSNPDTGLDLSALILNIAGKCNLGCDYCFAKIGNTFLFDDMSLETALKSVDFMVKSSPDKELYTVSLFGGEPFLQINMLEKFLLKVKEKYPNMNFFYTATTNGTIISKRHIKLIKDYNISLLISIDGTEKTTNNNRPFINGKGNTFKTILRNAEKLKANNINFTYRGTIVAGEDNIIEDINFFESQKVMYHLVFCSPTYNKDHSYAEWNDNNIKQLKVQFNELINYYYKKIEKKEFIYAEYILEKLQIIAIRKNTEVPCAAGKSMLAVNADGSLYSCMNYSCLNETAIGSLIDGVNNDKNNYYCAKNVNDLVDCRNCTLRHLCGGTCAAEKYTENGNPTKLILDKCKIEEITWTGYLELFQRIKNNYPEVIEEIANHKLTYECV